MKSIKKNIINFFKILKMIFYLNKEYVLKYNLIFIFRKLIIIWNFSFFYIINVDENIIKKMFKNIFRRIFILLKNLKSNSSHDDHVKIN